MSKKEIYRILNHSGFRLVLTTMIAALGGILLILTLVRIISGETMMLF